MTYPATPTYWLEPTEEVAVGLRRYTSRSTSFECAGGYHHALVYIHRAPAIYRTDESSGRRSLTFQPEVPHVAPRWPTVCEEEGCGYRFTDGSDDHWQDWQELIYRRPDTGQEYVLHSSAGADALGAPSAPPGAMWNAWWMPYNIGPDGLCLMCRCPNGHDWMVDSEASNCTRPGEPHQCWVRHGDPRSEPVTVDKNGDTCAAGAGSIQASDYHGFLQNGVLTAG